MYDTLNLIVRVDTYTMAVVMVLSAWASIIIRQMTDSTALGMLFMPIIAFGALLGIYACRQFDVVLSYERDTNIIMTAAVGMVTAMLTMLVITRVLYFASDRSVINEITKNGLDTRMMDK